MSEKMTLSELQLLIRDSLYISLPDMYWVIAEISEIRENYAGHCYLELIEKKGDDNNIRARAKAIIWCKKFGFLNSYFTNITGEPLREGLKILVRVKIEYHELYGLSLIICDIDPAYTVGEHAMKRQQIIRQLEQEGVFSMNKGLGLPFSMQRIAIISSSSAAGYTDFMNHLLGNDQGFVFYTRLFESPMQGNDTEQGIINALNHIAGYQDLFDIVVMIRGGGSQSDLSWFDNYNIAYHITQFPLPVLTGIGHEKDMSVSDMVAWAALKTPTAVADFIIGHMSVIWEKLADMLTQLKGNADSILEKYQARIETSGARLLPLSRIFLSEIRDKLSEKSMRLVSFGSEQIRMAGIIPASLILRLNAGVNTFLSSGKSTLEKNVTALKIKTGNLVQKKHSNIEFLGKNLELLDPGNILRRGYTITFYNGKIRKAKEDLIADDIIDTRFIDGTVTSRIINDKASLKDRKTPEITTNRE